ncbi:hypothetical protein [Bdellovibrio sp. GT3]|uniref:hypothetical protein n=1 Tax=Bdellovibrio sp. GT3 TaxID=3136282 RepID=UPI0030F0151A
MNKSTESNKPFKLIGIKEQRDSQAEGRPAKSFQEYPGLTPANEELETASDNVSQDENKEEIQEVTEININEFHESRRPLLHLSVDIDTDGHYNKEDTSNVTQVAEKTKKSKKGFKVKQTDRFKTPWFENLYASIKDSKVGHTSLLSEKELEKRLLEPLPEGFTMLEVLEAIRYRQREYRKDIMPQVSNWEELTGLTLEDYRPALGKLLTPQSLKQTLSALTRHYIEFLKDTYSSDVKSGVHRLKDPWSIKVLHLKSEVIGQFNEWLEHLETGYHLSDASKIRGVARLIFERTSNPIRTRATRYSSFNPEIEDLLRLYQTTGTSNEDSKSVASAARKAIKLAGIQTADELKSTKGLEKIAFLNYSGEVSDGDKSRSKKFFWWLGQEFKFKVPPYFESNKIETIHQLTDDQNAWFQLNIAQVLDKSISKRKDYKQQLDLYRLIMAQLSTRDVHKFTDVLPSDFIAAAALASKHQRNLGILRGLKGISQALVTYSSQKNKWKYCSAETFDQFENRCLDSIEGCGDRNLEQLDLNRYKPVFNSLDGSWSAFFPLIMQDFRAAALADEKCREGKRSVKKSLATPEHYKLIYENLLTVGHGKPCGNRKTGAVQDLYGTYRTGGLLDKNPNTLSQDEKRSLEKYTAYALQAFGG